MFGIGTFAALLAAALTASTPEIPLQPGEYQFQHRFVEQPSIEGIRLVATIAGDRIILRNPGPAGVFPHGVVAEGRLMWHAQSGQWVIGNSGADATASEVGGCTEGPEVVDLVLRIYWTC